MSSYIRDNWRGILGSILFQGVLTIVLNLSVLEWLAVTGGAVAMVSMYQWQDSEPQRQRASRKEG